MAGRFQMVERIDCGTAFCTKPSVGNSLTNSLLLSKLEEYLSIPTVGRTLSQYECMQYVAVN